MEADDEAEDDLATQAEHAEIPEIPQKAQIFAEGKFSVELFLKEAAHVLASKHPKFAALVEEVAQLISSNKFKSRD